MTIGGQLEMSVELENKDWIRAAWQMYGSSKTWCELASVNLTKMLLTKSYLL